MTPLPSGKPLPRAVHDDWVPAMEEALEQARKCEDSSDVPIGATVLDPRGRVIGHGWNRREADSDPTAHAEILALREAGARMHSWRLDECTLVVTLEPCVMCAGAIRSARISRVVFGAWEPKAGAGGSVYDIVRERALGEVPEVIPGVAQDECAALLASFFSDRR